MILSRDIKERALFEGFNKVGIVGAQSLTDEGRRLKEWLARGYHGEMGWMARDVEKRISPHEIFPPARSVVVVALNYFTPHQHQQSSSTGKVSRYAWGDDYHDVVKEKLLSLLAWIREQEPNAEGKVCVDIQPVMDKAWAVRAGLGWLGKHSNVITPEHGSWVFIGELLLNLELDHDTERVEDHCGTCTLCIDACPTAAITEPYVVDSNKCISYATIELRAPELPVEPSGWLYGCDICQDVCPWNRFEEPTSETRFAPREGNVNASLDDILELTPETYAARYRGSAMKRAKLHGLQRNARALTVSRARYSYVLMSAEEVKQSFAKQAIMGLIGAELSRVEPGLVEITLPFRPDLAQQHGYLHAGIVTTIADSACGYAAYTLMPPETEVLSVEFKVNLLRPAKGARFVAVAEVVKAGKTLTVVRADVFGVDHEGQRELVATMLGTMICVR